MPTLTPLQQLIADYIRDKADRGVKEDYSSIGRRAGMNRSTVQALASRDYVRRGPNEATIKKLARGLETTEQRVRDVVALSIGYGPGGATEDAPDIQLLLSTVRDLDPERLEIVQRRARMLHEEMMEERKQAERRRKRP